MLSLAYLILRRLAKRGLEGLHDVNAGQIVTAPARGSA